MSIEIIKEAYDSDKNKELVENADIDEAGIAIKQGCCGGGDGR